MSEPLPGQLRGVGLRLDPEGLLFSPHIINELQWGYTLKPDEGQPMIFMNGEWTEFIPKGVWLDMLGLWKEMKQALQKNIKDVPPVYINYPELELKNE